MDRLRRGIVCGLAAAATFGISAPLAKRLLPGWSPTALAATLYLGAGFALTAIRVLRWTRGQARGRGSGPPVRMADALPLSVMLLAGGLLGPILMLHGLERVSGLAAALLLNLEAPCTVLLAVLLFGEHLNRREAISILTIVAGAAILAAGPGELHAAGAGVLLIAAACLCWALDNNVTQRLSGRDPIVLTQIKTLGAGVLGTFAAAGIGAVVPREPAAIAGALGLGAVSYGLSVLLNTYALRLIGAAREAGVFATAPFFGAVVAIPVLGERPGPADLLAGLLMAVGVSGLLAARHDHRHRHERDRARALARPRRAPSP